MTWFCAIQHMTNFSSNFLVFNKLLSTQNVNVARFARNVEWNFFCDFQTLWLWRNVRNRRFVLNESWKTRPKVWSNYLFRRIRFVVIRCHHRLNTEEWVFGFSKHANQSSWSMRNRWSVIKVLRVLLLRKSIQLIEFDG